MSTVEQTPKVIEDLGRKPYPFQELVIKKIIKKDRFNLFLEMRLGKTLCAIKYLKQRGIKKVLIVAPLSVVPVWERELEMEQLKSLTFSTSNKELESVLDFWDGIVITNYEALTRTKLPEMEWDCVILDESHRIRRFQAKISKICATSFGGVKHKICLTGTPAPESLLDYYQQFRFLIGHFLGIDSYYEFKSSYFYTSYGNPKPEIKIPMVPIVKEFIKEHSIILRRSNPLVMDNLKNKKIYEQRYTELSGEAEKAYKEFEQTWLLKARDSQNNKDVFTNWIIVAQNYLHQMSGGFIKGTNEYFSTHKVDELKECWLNEIQGERVIIFARYRKEIEQMTKYLTDFRIKTITGDVKVRDRLAYVDELGEGKLDGLICQIKTASVGINMSCCDTAFYYSNTWEMVDRLQSEDRLVGPKTDERNSLLYIDFLTKGTIDEDIYNALQAKKEKTDLDFLQRVYNKFMARATGGK